MNRPRVVIVSLHFAEYSVNLAFALSKSWDVLLILNQENARNELSEHHISQLFGSAVSVFMLEHPGSVIAVISNTIRISKLILEYQPQLVHIQENLRDEVMLSLPFIRSIPIILTVHDPQNHSGRDSKRMRLSRYRFYRFIMRRKASLLLSHGDSLVKDLECMYPWMKGRVKSIGHGPLGARDVFPLLVEDHKVRLLFFGRIHEYKGLRYFVEAIIKLKSDGIPVIGVVAGRGADLERHRAEMEKAGCFEILNAYIPSVDVPKIFLESQVVVLPYIDGTQSGVAAMALGFGRPVVASAVGSIPELVRHGQNGLLVPPADTDALVDALRLVVHNKQLCTKLSAGAAMLRDGDLSWKVIADRMNHIYRSVCHSDV